MSRRSYTARDGTVYPLKEAQWRLDFKVYRSDFRKSIKGDPWECVESKGIKRNRNVHEAYIGSGRNAYIVFKATDDEPATAVHFVISEQAGRVRDAFDQDKKLQSQIIRLQPPSKTQTLHARAGMNKAYLAKIRNGTHVPKKRGAPTTRRMDRIGAPHRPRVSVSRTGSVDTHAE
jgi:hypothetical protein